MMTGGPALTRDVPVQFLEIRLPEYTGLRRIQMDDGVTVAARDAQKLGFQPMHGRHFLQHLYVAVRLQDRVEQRRPRTRKSDDEHRVRPVVADIRGLPGTRLEIRERLRQCLDDAQIGARIHSSRGGARTGDPVGHVGIAECRVVASRRSHRSQSR
jgi:hypothetical protein